MESRFRKRAARAFARLPGPWALRAQAQGPKGPGPGSLGRPLGALKGPSRGPSGPLRAQGAPWGPQGAPRGPKGPLQGPGARAQAIHVPLVSDFHCLCFCWSSCIWERLQGSFQGACLAAWAQAWPEWASGGSSFTTWARIWPGLASGNSF